MGSVIESIAAVPRSRRVLKYTHGNGKRKAHAYGIPSPDPPQDAEKHKDKDKSLVTLNESAVLSEIERAGRGLVKRIVVQI